MKTRMIAAATAILVTAGCLPPEWGAGAILHPSRRPVTVTPDLPFENVSFRTDDGLLLRGWLFRATGKRQGLVVYLHGIADNRQSGIGVAHRLARRGFDVLAYDSRAHGQSEGSACTYGFFEKHDLRRALDRIGATKAILFGSSLGGAVALQAAPLEPRVRGVIAQSAFSDLETIVRQRAPFFSTDHDVTRALALAAAHGRFRLAEVSPKHAAARIRIPVLLLHGGRDRETLPAHSRQIYDSLAGPRRLLILPEATHNDILARGESWQAINDWLVSIQE